jgi:hypothetical protein
VQYFKQRGIFSGDPFMDDFTVHDHVKQWPVFCHYTSFGWPANELPFLKCSMSTMVAERAEQAGYPHGTFSIHSLRAGMATSFVLRAVQKNQGTLVRNTSANC